MVGMCVKSRYVYGVFSCTTSCQVVVDVVFV